MVLSAIELAVHRKGTQHFINADYTDIILVPNSEVYVDGTKSATPQSPRSSQRLKIIWGGESGIVRETPNGVRRFDFILVGEYTATMEIGDQWETGSQLNKITYKFPDNGYEVKAGGVSHGNQPSG